MGRCYRAARRADLAHLVHSDLDDGCPTLRLRHRESPRRGYRQRSPDDRPAHRTRREITRRFLTLRHLRNLRRLASIARSTYGLLGDAPIARPLRTEGSVRRSHNKATGPGRRYIALLASADVRIVRHYPALGPSPSG